MQNAVSAHGIGPSFAYLIRKAIQRGIVQSYRESPSVIRLVIREAVIELDPEHARMLLSNRLRAESEGR